MLMHSCFQLVVGGFSLRTGHRRRGSRLAGPHWRNHDFHASSSVPSFLLPLFSGGSTGGPKRCVSLAKSARQRVTIVTQISPPSCPIYPPVAVCGAATGSRSRMARDYYFTRFFACSTSEPWPLSFLVGCGGGLGCFGSLGLSFRFFMPGIFCGRWISSPCRPCGRPFSPGPSLPFSRAPNRSFSRPRWFC